MSDPKLAGRPCPPDCPPAGADQALSFWGWAWRALARLPAGLLIGGVRLYKLFLSPLLGRNCRFTPTCSTYFIESVRKHGALKGAIRGVWRILRCNPWCSGGDDPP